MNSAEGFFFCLFVFLENGVKACLKMSYM